MNKLRQTLTFAFLIAFAFNNNAWASLSISLISDHEPGPGARHGMKKVISALQRKGFSTKQITSLKEAQGDILIAAGIGKGSGEAANLVKTEKISFPDEEESLDIKHIRRREKNILLISGTDDRGLMYALLDVADRIGWSTDPQDPLSEVQDITEKPYVGERALSMYTMHRSTFESFFYDRDFWVRFLDMVAEDRYNTFTLIFGYENAGYFAPPYPFFFDLDEFPDVHVIGMTSEKKQKNLKALNRIIEMTHERALNFTLGIWDHIYRGGVQGPSEFTKKPTPGVVWGLSEDNLTSYTKAALKKFLELVPNLDAIQFRMHGESGLKKEEFYGFWENIYQVMNEYGGDIRFDARAKNFPDILIDRALEMGVKMRLCTKYWMEQMGLPYHPTHVNRQNQFDRRHGYADLLKYPQQYKIHWRLFNSGTTRILLWGDPEYVRRFAKSAHLYNGESYEVNHPLSTKMQDHPHDMKPFELINAKYRYYDWEFERFWHFYQVFGRLGYNPETPPEVWQKEFEKRFGKEVAPYVEKALHRASKILPRIVAYNYPYDLFPTTRGWPEKYRMHDLPKFAKAEGSDTAQFLSPRDEARYQLEGKESAKIRPQESSEWFASTAARVLELVKQAEKRIGENRNKEFISTMVDIKILANLALYHSKRIMAALNWCLFEQSQDLNVLDRAILYEKRAIEFWEKIVEEAGDVYHDDLKMGRASAGLSGHWKDELVELKKDLKKIEAQRDSFEPIQRTVAGKYDFGTGPVKEGYQRIKSTRYPAISVPSGHYELNFFIDNDSGSQALGPMWIIANGMDFTDKFVVPAGEIVERKLFTEVVDNKLNLSFQKHPAANWNVNALIVTRVEPSIAHVPVRRSQPGKDLDVSATIGGIDPIKKVRVGYGNDQQGYLFIDLEKRGQFIYGTMISPPKTEDNLNYFIEAVDEKGRSACYPKEGKANSITITVTNDNEPPLLSHAPVSTAQAGKPLKISVNVSDPSGVKWVRLRYRSVNQSHEFKSLTMLPTGKKGDYLAVIPGEYIIAKWDFMYFFEVMDTHGNGKIYPDLEKETPYIVVKLLR